MTKSLVMVHLRELSRAERFHGLVIFKKHKAGQFAVIAVSF